MKSVTTSVRLQTNLATRLERAASRLSRGKNWIISKALEEYLAKVNQEGLAEEARRQSRMAARIERRRKPDEFWQEDIPEWR